MKTMNYVVVLLSRHGNTDRVELNKLSDVYHVIRTHNPLHVSILNRYTNTHYAI
jgi:hypothetical protein